jgi:hypothetical protein
MGLGSASQKRRPNRYLKFEEEDKNNQDDCEQHEGDQDGLSHLEVVTRHA